jgi:UDP-arabinose 4-epimerase
MSVIIVTGGAGFIGSHACKRLSAAGYRPVVIDDLSRGHEWAVKWGPLERGSILDEGFLDAVFRKWRPAGVIHFAALAYVGESFRFPLAYYRTNVVGTINVITAMLRHGCGHLVFSSSCATYGIPAMSPIAETSDQRPINPYGSTKLISETAIREIAASTGMRFVLLRYFNASGSDPELEIGEAHSPETHLIPLVLQAAAGETPHIEVFGDDYPTEDGACIRDYVHVSDLANAHVLALKALEDGMSSDVFNLGTGRGYSVKQVIETAQRVTGKTIPVVVGARRPGDPAELLCDPAKAISRLKWRPERAPLDVQIDDAWRWMNVLRQTHERANRLA